MDDIYKIKYIKYKLKYLKLKGGGDNNIHFEINIPIKLKKLMFPYKKGINYNNLKVNKESLYSSSRIYGAKFIINIIKNYFSDYDKKKIVITDGTSNIGTDAISLALEFDKVNAIELIDKNCKLLKHNINIYDLHNKIHVYCHDFLNIINDLEQDVIYIDPPWGGKSYKTLDKMNLYLGNKSVADIINLHKDKAKLILIKTPNNFDFDDFYKTINKDNVTIHPYIKKNGQISFYIIEFSKLIRKKI